MLADKSEEYAEQQPRVSVNLKLNDDGEDQELVGGVQTDPVTNGSATEETCSQPTSVAQHSSRKVS